MTQFLAAPNGSHILELGINPATTVTHKLQLSQAVSLKRIADALEQMVSLNPDNINTVQQLAWEAGRSFQQGTRTDR